MVLPLMGVLMQTKFHLQLKFLN